MSNSKDLAADVLHDSEIVVADPNTGLKMTHWRDGKVLVAWCFKRTSDRTLSRSRVSRIFRAGSNLDESRCAGISRAMRSGSVADVTALIELIRFVL
jgi:hypothetical protein